MEIEKPSLTSRSTTKTNTCISKTAFHKTKIGKCQRPTGTLHRNPYLNFLREFRQRNNGLSAVEIIRRGAKEWMNMTKEDKLQYIEEAFYAPKKRKAPPAPPPAPVQKAKLRMVSYPEDCGIVCPSMKAACGGKKKRRKKSKKAKCGKKRRRPRPKKKSCGKKRRPKRRPKKKRCPI